MVKNNIRERYSRSGYLIEVTNKEGTKANLEIYQGNKLGFSIRYTKSKKFITSSKNAESLARRFARLGHKKVVILD